MRRNIKLDTEKVTKCNLSFINSGIIKNIELKCWIRNIYTLQNDFFQCCIQTFLFLLARLEKFGFLQGLAKLGLPVVDFLRLFQLLGRGHQLVGPLDGTDPVVQGLELVTKLARVAQLLVPATDFLHKFGDGFRDAIPGAGVHGSGLLNLDTRITKS